MAVTNRSWSRWLAVNDAAIIVIALLKRLPSAHLWLLRCQRALLRRDKPLDKAAHVHAVGIGGDIDETRLAELGEPGLLRLDHLLVLDKGRRDLAIKLLGRFRLVLAVTVRHRPEIKAACLRFRRQAVEQ